MSPWLLIFVCVQSVIGFGTVQVVIQRNNNFRFTTANLVHSASDVKMESFGTPIFESPQMSSSKKCSIGAAAEQLVSAIAAAERGDGPTAVASFENMLLNAGDKCKPDVRKCNQLLKHLGDHSLLKETKAVYDLMVKGNVKLTVVTFCTLISRTGAAGRADYAQYYYREMLQHGIKPDIQVINSLINAYAKANHMDRVFSILKQINSLGLIPTVVTYNSVVEACCRSNNLDRARMVVEVMRKRKMQPNERTLSILINGLAKAGKIDEALEIFESMKNEGPLANEFTYATLIHACGKEGKLKLALQLYKDMRFGRNLEPNVVVWTALVDACGRGGHLSMAFSLLKEMLSCGVTPNEVTLSSLFNGCLKEREIDMAFQVLNLMREEGMDMQVAYTCLISECAKTDNPITALDLMERLKQNKIDQDIYEEALQKHLGTDMLRLLSKTKQLDMAFAVFRNMVNDRVPPNDKALQLVSDAVDSAKELDKALDAFDQMKLQQKGVNEVAYVALLGACGRVDRLVKGFLLLKEMKDSGQTPSEETYLSMMEICQESADPNTAVDFFLQMEKSGIQPGLKSYTSLLKAITAQNHQTSLTRPHSTVQDIFTGTQPKPKDEKKDSPPNLGPKVGAGFQLDFTHGGRVSISETQSGDNLFRVFLVFQEMRTRGIIPDRPAYNCLLSACAKAGDIEKALRVYNEMFEDGVPPDAITYTNLIKACSFNGEIEQAEEIFQTMQQRTNHFSTYVRPTDVTYATLMQGNNKCGRNHRVLELFEEMISRRMEPCTYNYREALKACYNLKDENTALKIYAQMRKKGTRLDNHSLLSMVKLLDERGKYEMSRKIREERSKAESQLDHTTTKRKCDD